MREYQKWTIADLPRQDGKTVVVTGGASGIGFRVAKELGARGARVVVLGRDLANGERAVAELRAIAGASGGSFELEQCDLADLASIAAFAQRWGEQPIHLAMNVAGVMAIPMRTTSADGFEMHMATNYLGHFALTGRLVPALRAGAARVVVVSALVGRMKMARLDPADLEADHAKYTPMGAYARSKLAEIMFAVELQRRAAAAGITSVAVDPGTARTNLMRYSRGVAGMMGRVVGSVIGYPLDRVAENVLYAAVLADPSESTLIGPSHVIQRCASPRDVGLPELARDEGIRDALWHRAEMMTGVHFALA